MAFTKSLFVLFALAVWVNALTTPHIARAHNHRAIAARLAVEDTQPFKPRQLSRRCKPRPSNGTLAQPSPPKVQPTPLAKPSPSPSPSPSPNPPKVQATPSPSPSPQVKPAPYVAPKPATTTPQAAPSPSPTNSGGNSGLPSFLVGTQTGQGTYYSTGLGACGITNQDTDYIAAVSHILFDAFPGYNDVNPNSNPICNRKVQVHYQGKSVTVAITDRCEGCALTDLDFSPSAFDQLADPSVGRLSGMTWVWI
ncbi:RlpA-like double-psi beta-barrel-containing domain containing protein [Amanita muscaria]